MIARAGTTTADRVLGMLYDRAEGFVSVDELRALVTGGAAAVDKALRALRRLGQKIEASPSHGVRLVRPAALDAYLIERDLGARRVGRGVICFGEVDSTNDVARDSARQKDADGLVVLAESQRHGRGRLGRRWLSPPRTNVLMSVLLIDAHGQLPHEAVTIAAGLATAEGIDQIAKVSCRLRWPNDVLLDGKKVAGVLVEASRCPAGGAVVIGIGVNVNAGPPPSRVAHPAGCLADQAGGALERIEVVRAILRRLDDWVAEVGDGRLDELKRAWLGRCGMIHHRVTLQCGPRRHTGRVMDIDPLEGLILCGDHGERIHLPAKTSTLVD